MPKDLPRRIPGQTVPPVANDARPLAYIPFVAHLGHPYIFWHETRSSLLRFDVVVNDYTGLSLYQVSLPNPEGLSGPLPGARHFSINRIVRSDVSVDKVHRVPRAEYFIVSWNQLNAPSDRMKFFCQLAVAKSGGNGTFAAQPLVELTPLDIPAGTLGRLWFDPFSGRACAMLTGGRVAIVDYVEVPKLDGI
jgi:hypothetical protein